MGKTIYTSKQPSTIDQGRVTHLKAVASRKSERFIWERLDCNQLTGRLTKQLVKHEHKYKHPP